MKKLFRFVYLACVMPLLTACDLAVDIFQGGMVFGILLVVLVIGGIVWLVTRGKK